MPGLDEGADHGVARFLDRDRLARRVRRDSLNRLGEAPHNVVIVLIARRRDRDQRLPVGAHPIPPQAEGNVGHARRLGLQRAMQLLKHHIEWWQQQRAGRRAFFRRRIRQLAHEIGEVACCIDAGAFEALGGHIELQRAGIHRGDVIGIARRIDAARRIEQRQQEFRRMFDDRQLLVLIDGTRLLRVSTPATSGSFSSLATSGFVASRLGARMSIAFAAGSWLLREIVERHDRFGILGCAGSAD